MQADSLMCRDFDGNKPDDESKELDGAELVCPSRKKGEKGIAVQGCEQPAPGATRSESPQSKRKAIYRLGRRTLQGHQLLPLEASASCGYVKERHRKFIMTNKISKINLRALTAERPARGRPARAWYNRGMTELTHIALTAPASVDMARVVGHADELLRIVQSSFAARITVRGDSVVIEGGALEAQAVMAVFTDLFALAETGECPTSDYVRRSIEAAMSDDVSPRTLREDILLTYRGRGIRPKTAGQKRYCDAIREKTVTFGIGPAGTGKTYLAMALAVAALKRKEVGRIILTRPVVEAGESLGFLPGTLMEKVDPYIRPLYDALYDMTDMERANQMIKFGIIEIAPLAFMRGRTLNDSFIILDEAQNTTPEQMKMFLTRLGFNSKMVVTGDASQTDLPRGASGLKEARSVLEGSADIAFVDFTGRDVVRHPLVASIVAAYDEAERSRPRGAAGRDGEGKA